MQLRGLADRDDQLSTLQAGVTKLSAEVARACVTFGELSAEVAVLLAVVTPGDDALVHARALLLALEEQIAETQHLEALSLWYAARLAGY